MPVKILWKYPGKSMKNPWKSPWNFSSKIKWPPCEIIRKVGSELVTRTFDSRQNFYCDIFAMCEQNHHLQLWNNG